MKRSLRKLLVILGLLCSGWLPTAVAAELIPLSELKSFAGRSLGVEADRIVPGVFDGVAQPILIDGDTVAYLGSTWAIAKTAGYSGRPVDVLVLVDTQAVIRGALLVEQEEPVLTLGIKPGQIASFVNGFAGYDLKVTLKASEPRAGIPDAIAGATISSGVIRSGVIRTARTIASHYGLLVQQNGSRVNLTGTSTMSWDALVANKSVARLHITAEQADAVIGVRGTAIPSGTFIDLYAAILDPPGIGVSLLGEGDYSALVGRMKAADHVIMVAANGLYSFKGTSWRKSGQFERIEIEQGSRTVALTRDQHHSYQKLKATGVSDFREIAVFVLSSETSFDPTLPFRLSLIASRDDASGQTHTGRFTLDYALPAQFLIPPGELSEPEQSLWQENWRARAVSISAVVAMLLALYFILIFQNQIAARPRLYRIIRITYLLTTIIVLGVLIGAQLSVVHVLTFVQALRSDFNWETFLLDPVIFIIWGWLAVALLFWGRVYCGWLCPFGALQELTGKIAQKLGVKQINVPFLLHERLWPIKYIAFLGLFAASLSSMTLAFRGAEIEPFKTVVTLRFMREWPFVFYAIGLLVAGMFIERFFCRYLCPLGAALAIPARLRMFEWLKRRPQCGRECRICSTKCPVQAIHPEGQINPNECVYCLNCQTLYYNEHICPPLKARAARRVAFNTPQRPE